MADRGDSVAFAGKSASTIASSEFALDNGAGVPNIEVSKLLSNSGEPGEMLAGSNPTSDATKQPVISKDGSSLNHLQMASFAWGLGMMGVCLVMIRNMILLRRHVRSLSVPLSEEVNDQFAHCLETRGISGKVSVLITGAVDSPALYGIFPPVILLPTDVMNRYSNKELHLVCMHELEHLLRRDHWMNVWTSILLVLHWFNPLVWYAVKRMRSDREFAVDEAVLRHSNADAETYGESILKAMNQVTVQRIQPGLIGILEDKTALKERFERIARFDVHKSESKGAWYLIVLILTCTFLSHPMHSDDEMSQDNSGGQVETPDNTEALNEAVRVLEQRVNAFGVKNPVNAKAKDIENKLKDTFFDEVRFVDEPIGNVIEWLYRECRSKLGSSDHINFVISGSKDGAKSEHAKLNLKEMIRSKITIDPPMKNASAWDICHRIAGEMTVSVKIRVADYALLFCYDSSEDHIKFETRTYRLPNAERLIQLAKDILQVQPDEEWDAFESLRKIFKAAGLSLLDQPDTLTKEEEQSIQSLFYPLSKPPSDPLPDDSKPDGRAVFYKPDPGMLFVRAPVRELTLVDKIVETLVYSVPASVQITIEMKIGFLTRTVPKDSTRHILLRPLGKETGKEDSVSMFSNQQFHLSLDEADSYWESIRGIQGVELVPSRSVTTLSHRPATWFVPLEKEGNLAAQFFASGPADMKVEVHPAINQKAESKLEMVVGLNAILPGLSRKGQFVVFPDGSQFPEINGGGIIPKGKTLLVHYSRSKRKGLPWEESDEEWLQEFVVLVTPTLIDPAGNRID